MKLKQEIINPAMKYFYYLLLLFFISTPKCLSQNTQSFSVNSNNDFASSIQNNSSILNNDSSNSSENNYEKYFRSYSYNQSDKNSIFYNSTKDSLSDSKTKWYKTDTGTSLIVAGVLIGLGTYIQMDDSFIDKVQVRDEINRYLPDFHNPIDDVLQYIPFVAVYAIDLAGIKSKHNATRKLTTIGTAIALNLIVVQGLKYSVAEPRPDGSGNNSFPSGHTATAFMGAHIFHKEYGHRSPFYSIAGYTLASITGVYRQLNNRHWISDVFAGAGIGIGVTELAYFLNDKWWDEKGINEYEPTERIINNLKPSFVRFKAGYASLIYESDDNEPGITSKSGFKISFEGAYFFNKNFGIGGELGFQSFPNTIDDSVIQEFNSLGYDILPESSGNNMYYIGGYYQYPFGKNAVGTKLLAGGIAGAKTQIIIRELDTPEDETPKELVYAEYVPSLTFSWATGVYFKRYLGDNVALSIYGDYHNADLNYEVKYIERIDDGVPIYNPLIKKTTIWDSYSVGVGFDLMLW